MVPDQFYQEIIRKNERQEYSNGSQGSRHNGAPHFFCSLRYRTFGRIAVSRQTINILKHHDTIIQQHSDGQRHSYQGKTIDSNTKSVEEVESRIDRNRYGKCDKNTSRIFFRKSQRTNTANNPPTNARLIIWLILFSMVSALFS